MHDELQKKQQISTSAYFIIIVQVLKDISK